MHCVDNIDVELSQGKTLRASELSIIPTQTQARHLQEPQNLIDNCLYGESVKSRVTPSIPPDRLEALMSLHVCDNCHRLQQYLCVSRVETLRYA